MENNRKITIIGGTEKVGRLQLDNTKWAIMFPKYETTIRTFVNKTVMIYTNIRNDDEWSTVDKMDTPKDY